MSKSDTRIEEAAGCLLNAHRTRRLIETLPFMLDSVEQGYAIQRLMGEQSGPRSGWKVALDATGKTIYAPLYDKLSYPSPAQLNRHNFNRFLLECELAIAFIEPLPPRSRPYEPHEIQAAAGKIHAAMEIIDTRFTAWPNIDPLWLLADGLSHGCFILGEGVAISDPGMLEHADYQLTIGGLTAQQEQQMQRAQQVQRVQRAHPQPDPWATLTQLANLLCLRGEGLMAGDVVTTGTFSGANPLERGQQAAVVFAGVGSCSVVLEE
jgi:2-keto-4-pentenoate hydratase